MRIAVLLLAAGEGRRIGGPKALLPIGGTTFLVRCARALARPGVGPILAVTGCEAERVAAAAREARELELVANPRYREGMLGSILAGLDAAEARGAEAVLLHPVDHPLVAPETVERVVAALRTGARIAVPSVERRRGHPAGFAAATWPALRAAPAGRGARAVLADHPDWIEHVPGDPGSIAGIDTPDDYERLLGTALPR